MLRWARARDKDRGRRPARCGWGEGWARRVCSCGTYDARARCPKACSELPLYIAPIVLNPSRGGPHLRRRTAPPPRVLCVLCVLLVAPCVITSSFPPMTRLRLPGGKRARTAHATPPAQRRRTPPGVHCIVNSSFSASRRGSGSPRPEDNNEGHGRVTELISRVADATLAFFLHRGQLPVAVHRRRRRWSLSSGIHHTSARRRRG